MQFQSYDRHILQKDRHTPIFELSFMPSATHQTKHPVLYGKTNMHNSIDPALQQIRLAELRGFLQFQKYPPKLIDDGIEKAKGLSLSQLRTPRKKVERNIIPFVNTHDPGVTNIFSTMKANLPILLQSPKMRDLRELFFDLRR